MDKPFIVALDFSSKEEVRSFLQLFSDTSLFLKVGMELYFQEGPAIIDELKQRGHDIFLDLKLHDIPHTVKRAMKGLAKLGIDLVNVHASGGKRDDARSDRRIRRRNAAWNEASPLHRGDAANEHKRTNAS